MEIGYVIFFSWRQIWAWFYNPFDVVILVEPTFSIEANPSYLQHHSQRVKAINNVFIKNIWAACYQCLW